MTNRMSRLAGGVGLATLVALGCAPAARAQSSAPAPAAVHVRIVLPKGSSTIAGPSVHVVLEAQGIEIAPAAEHRAGTAHHHLFLDTDITASDAAIPMGTPGVVHLGKGQSEYSFEGVAPGTHRLIAVLADPNHIPLNPLVADTVRFDVK